jgi:hypothetical protein
MAVGLCQLFLEAHSPSGLENEVVIDVSCVNLGGQIPRKPDHILSPTSHTSF